MQHVVVTGANSGIGLALAKQLAAEHGCHVHVGARSAEKCKAAIDGIVASAAGLADKLSPLVCDPGSDSSVIAAAAELKSSLPADGLYALVNNAGTGLQHNATPYAMLNVNLEGVKRMCESFMPLLSSKGSRVVNVGSTAGPTYVGSLSSSHQPFWCKCPPSWEALEEKVKAAMREEGFTDKQGAFGVYGISKAAVASYSMLLAKEHPNVLVSTIAPGFIKTALMEGYPVTTPPEEGTVSIRKCLFDELGGSGWFYESDGVRSPLHVMRRAGQPAYDGVPPG